MDTIYWSTEDALSDNNIVMSVYLDAINELDINELDITMVDGTYAEGINALGEKYAIHASGNGDFFNHKIEFVKI